MRELFHSVKKLVAKDMYLEYMEIFDTLYKHYDECILRFDDPKAGALSICKTFYEHRTYTIV